jgi:hypothetical protein
MLSVAIATCRPESVALLIRTHAPLDGLRDEGLPLRLALRAKEPELALLLLKAGASPDPQGGPSGPRRTAITVNALDAIRMLLDSGMDPNVMEATGNRPLHTAVDMEHFPAAELLLDRGADPWAIDSSGANLASSATMPMATSSAAEESAQLLLAARARSLGRPMPVPSPRAIARSGYKQTGRPRRREPRAPRPFQRRSFPSCLRTPQSSHCARRPELKRLAGDRL